MKKLLLSGVAFIALAVGPALAADLPRKAPAYQSRRSHRQQSGTGGTSV